MAENKKAEAIIKKGLKHKLFSREDKRKLFKNPKKLMKKTQIEKNEDKKQFVQNKDNFISKLDEMIKIKWYKKKEKEENQQ